MIKLLTKFWPILLPLIIYGVWLFVQRKRRKGDEPDEALLKQEARLWQGALILSIIIAFIYVLLIFMTTESNTDGAYVPAEYKDGKLIPGRVVPNGNTE